MPHPGQPGERLYRTGDRVRLNERGELVFCGRVDRQVKLRGHRIELGEIEAALRQHANVRECVVRLVQQEELEPRLVGYIVPRSQLAPERQELRAFLQELLPEVMIPWAVVSLRTIPLTRNGKVDERQLPPPSQEDAASSTTMEREEVTPIEAVLVGIWEDVLHVKPIGLYDNFTVLGGHSLLATQIISRVRSALQVEIPLRELFEGPTIAQLGCTIAEVKRQEQGIQVPPLVPVSREQLIPLSFAQQRLWFLDQLEPESVSYNVPLSVRMRGTLQIAVLERALHEIVRRHEILHTTFAVTDGEPVQVIGPAHFQLEHIDLGLLPADMREDTLLQLVEQEAVRPFDLARGPMLRATLVCLENEDQALLLTLHHIVSDGWSRGLLVHELTTLYTAFIEGRPSPLAALPVQYADFAIWQRQWLQGSVLQKHLTYWQEQLKDIEPLNLPLDKSRPAVISQRGARRSVLIPSQVYKQLKHVSERQNVTLFMTLLAAFEVLLARYGGQNDIVIGSPIANRNQVEIEPLIGFFVNTLVLRTNLAGASSFKELLARVREVAIDAYLHQDVPFEKIVEVLQPERDLSRSPIFQVFFILQNATSRETNEMVGLELSALGRKNETTKFDLSLVLTETSEGLLSSIDYCTDLFDSSTIERLLHCWVTLLHGISTDINQSIVDLPLLSASEQQYVLELARPDTSLMEAEVTAVHRLFGSQAERKPDSIAVIYDDEQITYRELHHRVTTLATYLQSVRCAPEVRVGLFMERSITAVISFLAILKAGGVYVPLDPGYPPDRLAFIASDADISILLTQARLRNAIPANAASTICSVDPEWTSRISEPGVAYQECLIDPHNLAYIIYTSGSTGQPKGVLVEHQGLENLVDAQRTGFQLAETDRILQFASICFDASISELLMGLCNGIPLCLASAEALLPGTSLIQLINVQRISVITLPPSVLATLSPQDIAGLDTIIVAGEACSAKVIQRWGPGRQIFNAYGPTEDSVCATIGVCSEHAEERPPIGRPVSQQELFIIDQHGRLTPSGVPGEVYIGGIG